MNEYELKRFAEIERRLPRTLSEEDVDFLISLVKKLRRLNTMDGRSRLGSVEGLLKRVVDGDKKLLETEEYRALYGKSSS